MDVLESYFKRLCISGAADRIAALQDQIRKLTAQLADGQTTLYYSEAANLRLTTQLAEQSNVRDDRAALLAAHSDLQDDKAALQKQLQQAQDMSDILQEQLTTARLRGTRLEQQLVLEQNRNRPLRDQVAAAEGQSAQMQSQITALVAQHRAALNQQPADHTQLGRLLVYLLQRPVRALPPPQELAVTPASRISDPQLQYDTLEHSLNLQGVLASVVPLTYAMLSVRTANALQRAHIVTVNALAQLTPRDLLLLPNVGVNSLQEIAEYLDTRWSQLPADHFQQPTSPHQDDMDELHEQIRQLTATLTRSEAHVDQLQEQVRQAQDVTRTLREQVVADGQSAQLERLRPNGKAPGQVLQLPESQHRPLLAALNLPGLLQATVPLAALGLSTRSRNSLFRCGRVQTLNDLLNWTPYDLLQLRDVGPHTLKEVEARLCALWPQLPPEYFQLTVPYAGPTAAAWRVQPPYGRPRY